MSKSMVLILAILAVWFFVVRGDSVGQTYTRYTSAAGTFTTGQGFAARNGTLGGGSYGGGGGQK